VASERVAHITFVVYVIGVALMTSGLGLHHAPVVTAGIALLAMGILLFVANLVATLRLATRRELTWWALALAAAFLVVALAAGIALTINRFTGFLGASQPHALRVHLHTALYGWVMLVIVGVSHRLLPMFLLSHGADDRFAWWSVQLLAAGAALVALFHHVPVLGREVPLLLLAAGLVAWIVQARRFYRHRHRPALDAGLRLSAIAIMVLAVVPLPLVLLELPAMPASVRVLYAGTLVLGAALFVAAQYYKIVPFLVWNQYFGPLAGKQPLPRVAELFSAREAMVAVWLLSGAGLLLLGGVALRAPWVVRSGATLLAGGAVVEARQLLMVSRRRP
ncbi:MAG TPA: hypothetical protein PLL69_10480, partial [Gemmatimonadales bacterium]|nr:hypothetical protein [Gemmatimonadales bacterium]